VHLLPIYPSSGDGGFAPLCYDVVDPRFGSWEDVESLSKDYDLMLELMVNHISPKSHQFQDFLEKGDASEYASMFIDWRKFWGSPGGRLAPFLPVHTVSQPMWTGDVGLVRRLIMLLEAFRIRQPGMLR
jgi:glycosidase